MKEFFKDKDFIEERARIMKLRKTKKFFFELFEFLFFCGGVYLFILKFFKIGLFISDIIVSLH